MSALVSEWRFEPQTVGYKYEEAVEAAFPGVKVKEARIAYKRKPARNGQRTLSLLIQGRDHENRPRLVHYFMDEGDRLTLFEGAHVISFEKDSMLVV